MGAIIFGVSVVMTYGFYKLIQGARELQYLPPGTFPPVTRVLPAD